MTNSILLEEKVAAMRGELDALKDDFKEHKHDLKHRERMDLFAQIFATLDRINWRLNAIFFLCGVLYLELLVVWCLVAKKAGG